MKALGVFIFLLGMFVFASGWMLLDLASMPLKDDLYSIDILGLFIIMGCLMAFSGAIMCDRI